MFDDGLFGIKVVGFYLVEVSSIEVEKDGFCIGSCKVLEFW